MGSGRGSRLSRKPPKVSCLMVTADRKRFVRRALLCYRRQAYPHKELVIVDDGDERLDDLLEGFPPGEVLYHRLERRPANVLGRLRNLSLELATGDLCANWDDDDWYHPERLAAQVRVIEAGASSCSLAAALVHLDAPPFSRHAFLAPFRKGVPGSLMYPREGSIRHPETRRGEDDAFLREWQRRPHRMLEASFAGLMVRCFHGANTWDKAHFVRRLTATWPDALHYAWCRWARRDVLRHRLFRLPEAARLSLSLFLEDSRALGLMAEE
jgi:glycosyltransferase involved in cell wall biosynthesis